MSKFKKICTAILSIVTLVCCSSVFAACGNDNNDNDKDSSNVVSSTDSSHYDSSSNNDSNNDTPAAVTREELAAAFKDSANAAFTQLGFAPSTTTTKAKTPLRALPVVGEEVDENSTDAKFLKANAIGNVALIQMIGELYENQNFVVTDEVICFSVNYLTGAADLSILPKIDKTANKVESELVLNVPQASCSYFYFDLNYDFDTKTLSSFSIHIAITSGDTTMYQCQRMENGKFYLSSTPDQTYIDALAAMKSEFNAKSRTALQLTENFQTEFDGYTSISQKAFQDAANG